jgi:hypothetical protein
MHLHGIIQTANLQEIPPESGNLEILLKVQGVGPGQPRTLVIPYPLLLADENLDPDAMQGRAFDAEVDQDQSRRWLVFRIALASRILRPSRADE